MVRREEFQTPAQSAGGDLCRPLRSEETRSPKSVAGPDERDLVRCLTVSVRGGRVLAKLVPVIIERA